MVIQCVWENAWGFRCCLIVLELTMCSDTTQLQQASSADKCHYVNLTDFEPFENVHMWSAWMGFSPALVYAPLSYRPFHTRRLLEIFWLVFQTSDKLSILRHIHRARPRILHRIRPIIPRLLYLSHSTRRSVANSVSFSTTYGCIRKVSGFARSLCRATATISFNVFSEIMLVCRSLRRYFACMDKTRPLLR